MSVLAGRRSWLLATVMLLSAVVARADDEIQVYNGEITQPGKWTGQYHLNYAIKGRKEPEFPGGLIPNRTTNGTAEFAYGVTNWFEFGFYVPWAYDKDGFHSNAMKLRTLFVTPDAGKRNFFYGLNIEYDYLMPKFSETRWGMEIRPIIGWRFGDYEFIVNPIVDLSFGSKGEVTFVPNMRFARNFGEDFAIAVEYYTDLGPIQQFLPLKEQGHNIYGVVDFKVDRFDIEFGVGYGFTPGSDKLMTKLMITTNLFDEEEKDEKNGKGGGKNGKGAMASSRIPHILGRQAMSADLPVKARKQPTRPAGELYDWGGCYVGGYWGGPEARAASLADPVSTGGVFARGTFYNAPFANAANGGRYDVEMSSRFQAGGTVGCNWHIVPAYVLWGIEGEAGYLSMRGADFNPYGDRGLDSDTVASIRIGDWYAAMTGRVGWTADRALIYLKAGLGFTDLKSTVVDNCNLAACSAGLLAATYSKTRALWVAGAGIEWAFTGNWRVKAEYLFLGLTDTFSACGPGGGSAAGSTFCADHRLGGIHTMKVGLNYRLN